MAGKLYWTARDGQIGTAHKNRDGKEVDFRPARWIQVFLNNSIRAEVPKGQEHAIDPLVITSERIEIKVVRKDYPHTGIQIEQDVFRVNFCGEDIIVEGRKRQEWYDLTAKAVSEAAHEERLELYHTRRDKGKEFIKSFPIERIADEVTRSEADRLRNGKITGEEVARRVILDAGKAIDGRFRDDFWREVTDFARQISDQVKVAAIDAEEKRRAEKKAQWMVGR